MKPPPQIDLGYLPRDWQRECHQLKRKNRFAVLALHRRAGKTLWALMELVHAALQFDKELGLFFFVAPTLKQAKAIAWRELKRILEPLRIAGLVEIRETELTVEFKHNGARISLFGADNPDAMRGVRLDGVVIDEVGHVPPDTWFSILQPTLSDRLGWAVFIGTPNGINLFSELFFKATDEDEWHAGRYTVSETQALDAKEVERLRRDMPDTAFAREYLCDFSAGGEDQLISLSDVESAAQREWTEREVAGAPRILGVDVARFGSDRSVVIKRQGLHTWKPIVYKDVDLMTLASAVASIIQQWRPDAVFVDSGGVGAGLVDRLRQLHFDVHEVNSSSKAGKPDAFTNRRAECWSAMADWVRGGGSIPNDTALKQELATPVYSFDASGRKKLESKDDIKKRLGGGSPDTADALALTFASPVTPATEVDRVLEQFDVHRPRAKTYGDHDPFAVLDEVEKSHDPFAWRR